MLQGDMRKGDVFFQYTTVTWMMWHWLVSGLAVGATIVLYDGSPFRPLIDGSGDLAMARLIDEFGYVLSLTFPTSMLTHIYITV
jgi:acetoacetyl-CoA synthetase